MYMENGALLEADYPAWLARLGAGKEPPRPIPGFLVETSRDRSPREWGQRLLSPLEAQGLFPFRGENLWVEAGCTEWEQAASIPRHLARRCTEAAGLWGNFCGGAVIDLRWCGGAPLPGQLRPLEHFLVGGTQLLAVILVAPGALEAVREQLALVDLQQILPAEEAAETLRKTLETLSTLTQEEKRVLLERPEYAAVMLRKVQRMGAAGAEEIAQMLMPCARQSRRRLIGFGREAER